MSSDNNKFLDNAIVKVSNTTIFDVFRLILSFIKDKAVKKAF